MHDFLRVFAHDARRRIPQTGREKEPSVSANIKTATDCYIKIWRLKFKILGAVSIDVVWYMSPYYFLVRFTINVVR